MNHHWKVWTEDDAGNETEVLCEGSHAKCLSYYKQHGGERAGLHLGYEV